MDRILGVGTREVQLMVAMNAFDLDVGGNVVSSAHYRNIEQLEAHYGY